MPNNTLHTTELLVERAKGGDRQSFSDLIYLYKDKSFSLACSILKDEPLAEDVLQNAFLKAYKHLKDFRMSSKFSTWLYRIVVNTAYNELKKRNIRPVIKDVTEEIINVDGERSLDTLKHLDQQHYIKKAMAKINADEALALRLFYLCEMKISEIQEITGYSTSKIKVDLHRGRSNVLFQLKRLLGKELNDLL